MKDSTTPLTPVLSLSLSLSLSLRIFCEEPRKEKNLFFILYITAEPGIVILLYCCTHTIMKDIIQVSYEHLVRALLQLYQIS